MGRLWMLNLPSDGELIEVLIADWAVRLVLIVEHDGDTGFGDPSLALLVH